MCDFRVVCAAVKFHNVKDNQYIILTAKRHADCYEQAYNMNLEYDNTIDGFMTNMNEFVDRYDAKKIAIMAHQLIVPIEDTYAALYSEDVW